MNKAWYCGALALMLSGCTLPSSLFHQAEPQVEDQEDGAAQQLKEWVALSNTVINATDGERQQALAQLPHTPKDELKRAVWLSYARANTNQRQQAQQLFQQHLTQVAIAEQQLLGIYQQHNQQVLQLQRQVSERQQQVDNLTRKLKELANIEQQINERKFQE